MARYTGKESKKLPTTIIVNVLNHEHKPSLTWTFTEAYPVKYQTSGISSSSKEVIIETITFKFSNYSFRQNDQKKPKQRPLNIKLSNNKKSSRIKRDSSQRKLDEVRKKPLNIELPNNKESSRISRDTSKEVLMKVNLIIGKDSVICLTKINMLIKTIYFN